MNQTQFSCDIEQHAVLFGLMAKTVFERWPESGEQTIRACVRAYGSQRGGRMAARCLANGDPLTPRNYQAYNERSSRPGQMNSVPAQKEPEFVIHVQKCAWVDAWRQHGLLEYGKYYCLDIDKTLTRSFSPDYEVQINGLMSWGEPYCDMHWGFPMDAENERYIQEKRASLASGSILNYDYHTGHLFSAMTEELQKLLREAGVEAARDALTEFCKTFGAGYVRSFAAAYPLTEPSAKLCRAVLEDA